MLHIRTNVYVRLCLLLIRYAGLCKSDSEICPISEITVTAYTLRFSCAHTRVQTYMHLSTHLVWGGAT